MKLREISDITLVQKAETFVREERAVLTNLLHHFKEIERRRLFCDYKYPSLFKMLIGHFGYSEDEAFRRVSAMRLIADLPEVEGKINQGELSLSHLGLAHSYFRQEKKVNSVELSKTSKLQLLSEISKKPIREAQRIVISKSSPESRLRPDKIEVVSENKTEYRFTANKSFDDKLDELKGLLAHKYPNISLAELLELVCDLGIERLKKEKIPATPKKQRVTSNAGVRKQVRAEGDHRCSNCMSTFAVEIDHKRPRAAGGLDIKENLRLLCRPCNQRAAIKHFGIRKMEKYLVKPSG
ncbi:MAG: hypothetical protein K0R29_2832 [Pseudobdellovibrio sp.]|jgi:hypothetical protein|nr:hypothetical protein [Pseudobdellovibrio sp.]